MTEIEILNLARKVPECGIPGKLLTKGYVKQIDSEKSPLDFENLEITNKGRVALGIPIIKLDLSWINEYRDKFKSCNIGKTGDKSLVVSKMEDFILTHNYSKEDILRATDNYISQLNGQYAQNEMMNAEYFISYTDPSKDKRSKLLTFCEQLNDIVDNKWS